MIEYVILWILIAYFIGAIPFGLLLTRLFGADDIRHIGSGNIGATNVLRTSHWTLAALVLVLDASKGWLAVMLTHSLSDSQTMPYLPYLAAMAVFLGHIYPIWLKFKGGKGVATYFGVLLGLYPLAGVVFGIIWLAVLGLGRRSSVAALVACTLTPLILYFLGSIVIAQMAGVLSVIAFWTHRANMKRLLNGTEPKIGQ